MDVREAKEGLGGNLKNAGWWRTRYRTVTELHTGRSGMDQLTQLRFPVPLFAPETHQNLLRAASLPLAALQGNTEIQQSAPGSTEILVRSQVDLSYSLSECHDELDLTEVDYDVQECRVGSMWRRHDACLIVRSQEQMILLVLDLLPHGRVKVVQQELVDGNECLILESVYVDADASKSISADINTSECVICMSQKRNVILLPCKHLILCSCCAKEIGKQSERCPICRQPFESFLRIAN